MAKYALIDQENKVGQLLIAESLEVAQDLANTSFYGIKEVVEVADQENAALVAIGCGWDGEDFIPHSGTELDEANPTTWTVSEE